MTSTSKSNPKVSENDSLELRFFEEKEAPKFWQFCYKMLKNNATNLRKTAIIIALIMMAPSFVSVIFSQAIPATQQIISTYQQHQDSSTQHKIAENKEIIKGLDLKAIRDEVKNSRSPYDNVYESALPIIAKMSNFTGDRDIAIKDNESFNKDFNSSFSNVYKLIAVMEVDNDSAYATISKEEILNAIQTLRSYRMNKQALSHPSYHNMLKIVSKK